MPLIDPGVAKEPNESRSSALFYRFRGALLPPCNLLHIRVAN